MSYKIRYKTKGIRVKGKQRTARYFTDDAYAAFVVFLLSISILTFQFMRSDWDSLRNAHIKTKSAVYHMLDDMRGGKSLDAAVTAFCQEIIEYGKQ